MRNWTRWHRSLHPDARGRIILGAVTTLVSLCAILATLAVSPP